MTLYEFNRFAHLNFYTVLPMESLCFQEERRGTSEDLAALDLSRHHAVGGLEIGRIYMGNNAGLVLEICTAASPAL